MSIEQFTRDAAYFQTRRDSGMLLNAEDLDFQFNNLIDYLNVQIVPMINSFTTKELIGINDEALQGAGLLNVGDGSVKWQKIDPNIFPDHSIPLSKFYNSFSGVLYTYNNYWSISGISDYDIQLDKGYVLISPDDKSKQWRQIRTGDIADKTLQSDQIALGEVKIEHLDEELREELLTAPKTILNQNIGAAQITQEHLQDYSITAEKIDPQLLQARTSAIVSKRPLSIVQGTIETRHISDQTSRRLTNLINSLKPEQYQEYIPDESITGESIRGWHDTFGTSHIVDGAIEPRHIQDKSFNFRASWSLHEPSLKQLAKIPASALDPIIRAKLGV